MNKTFVLFAILTAGIFVQLLLGGLLTFNFITPPVHIVVGFAIFAISIAAMIFVFVEKRATRKLRIMSALIVALIVVQILLGFSTLKNGDQAIAWGHFANSLLIFGVSIVAAITAASPGKSSPESGNGKFSGGRDGGE